MAFFEGLGAPTKPHIYEISKTQEAKLAWAADPENSVCFAALESLPTDDDKKRQEFDLEMREMEELTALGLLTDESHRFQVGIEASRLNNNGRGFKVFAITIAGLLAFKPAKGRTWVN